MKKATILPLISVWIFFFLFPLSGFAQIPVEISVGHSNYYYQHAFAGKFHPEKPIGFFHTSSILIPYDKNRGNELMSQSYVSYALSKMWSTGIGSIFTPVDRVRPSVFVQYFLKKKALVIMIYPRADIWKDPNVELMGFIEYQEAGSRKPQIYVRLQYMTTWNLHKHVRSYQYLRLGINLGKLQFGQALSFDQYGSSGKTYYNIGLFLRKEF